jgi:uncharacterized protein
MVSEEFVREVFDSFEKENYNAFFGHIAEDCICTVQGNESPIYGEYHGRKEIREKLLGRIKAKVSEPMKRKITHVFVSGDWGIVEHTAVARANNGTKFDMQHCWISRFKDGKIVEMRLYMDTAMVVKAFKD